MRTKRIHRMPDAFVFLLLGVFACFLVMMVLFAAGMYKNVRAQADDEMNRRLIYHSIANTVRAHDEKGAVSLRDENGTSVLVLTLNEENRAYETMIYCYDGAVRQLYLEADKAFTPEYGEIIVKASSLEMALNQNVLTLTLTDEAGRPAYITVALQTAQEEASL